MAIVIASAGWHCVPLKLIGFLLFVFPSGVQQSIRGARAIRISDSFGREESNIRKNAHRTARVLGLRVRERVELVQKWGYRKVAPPRHWFPGGGSEDYRSLLHRVPKLPHPTTNENSLILSHFAALPSVSQFLEVLERHPVSAWSVGVRNYLPAL